MDLWEIIGNIVNVLGILGVSLGAFLAWVFARRPISFRYKQWRYQVKYGHALSEGYGYIVIVGHKAKSDIEADVKNYCNGDPELKCIRETAIAFVETKANIEPQDVAGIISKFEAMRQDVRKNANKKVMHFFSNVPIAVACQLIAPLSNNDPIYVYHYQGGTYLPFGVIGR
ncbi:MAG: hypothetical protein LBJ11_09320 [Oscillospiraceae bacterium]|jgi:hypothetical protein|nr:hypothetical protein [Oscillospiraceae bacterium]